MSAIGKCPWCGGEATMDRIDSFWVGCDRDGCLASGPNADTPEAAITAWNRLATPGQGEAPTDLAPLTELLAAADECAGVAETGVERKYWATLWGRDDPGYKRDMAPVRRLRAAVARVRGE